jgi:CDP-6-deoxy-D-xylo-4-hexulose-3-dehydrase
MEYKLATSTWDHKEIDAIHEVIQSDMFSMGEKVEMFEKDFANFIGSKYSVMCNSGSSANLLMVGALFYSKIPYLKRGDEIIVPTVSWSTSYFPLQQYGLKLKFVDINLKTLNYELTELKKAVNNNTKAILAVNLLGNPNDFDQIFKIIDGRNIVLIEDNCESLGAKYNGKHAGTFGLMGTFSSFFSHHIATMEGGIVVTDNEELYHILLCLRAHGWTRNLPKKNHILNKSNNWFEESFKFVLPGYNFRPIEMSGAIGIEQLKKLPDFINQRRKNADLFKKLFENDNRFIIQKEIGESSWFGFSLVINDTKKRAEIVQLLELSNIESRPIVAGDFTQNPALKFIDFEIVGDLPNSKKIHNDSFFVGNSHLDLTNELHYLRSKLLDL